MTSTYSFDKIVSSINTGNFEEFKLLVEEKDAILNTYPKSESEETLGNIILYSKNIANNDKIDWIHALFQNGYDVNLQDFYGATIGERAVNYGYYDIFTHAFNNGLDVNISSRDENGNNTGYTVVHSLINADEVALILLILDKIDFNAKDANGYLYFHYYNGKNCQKVIDEYMTANPHKLQSMVRRFLE
jgi:ankyrin repeat protein